MTSDSHWKTKYRCVQLLGASLLRNKKGKNGVICIKFSSTYYCQYFFAFCVWLLFMCLWIIKLKVCPNTIKMFLWHKYWIKKNIVWYFELLTWMYSLHIVWFKYIVHKKTTLFSRNQICVDEGFCWPLIRAGQILVNKQF